MAPKKKLKISDEPNQRTMSDFWAKGCDKSSESSQNSQESCLKPPDAGCEDHTMEIDGIVSPYDTSKLTPPSESSQNSEASCLKPPDAGCEDHTMEIDGIVSPYDTSKLTPPSESSQNSEASCLKPPDAGCEDHTMEIDGIVSPNDTAKLTPPSESSQNSEASCLQPPDAELKTQSCDHAPKMLSLLPTPEIMNLFKEHFGDDVGKLHNYYYCSGNCSTLPEPEVERIKNEKEKSSVNITGKKKRGIDMFRHGWLTDKTISFCAKTGLWWLVYVEGKGMYCLLCRMHNNNNKYNKLNIFNLTPSSNYKRSAINEHQQGAGHISTQVCELERRNSSLAAMHRDVHDTKDRVTYNAFLTIYWLGEEEVSNKKLLPLIDLHKQVGVNEMAQFKNTSERSQQDMRILIGQLVKAKLIENVKEAKWFSILVDEVTDCSVTEQLLIYIGYVDVKGEAHFDYLDCKDVLETSHSADAKTITSLILQELKASDLNPRHLCGFGSDGASVMTGKTGGVGARLQAVSPLMLRSHCISHRLALACGDANENVKYISTVETILRQLWKWLEYPKRCSAFVKVCKNLHQIELSNSTEKQKKLRKRLAVKIQKACRTRWLSTGQSIASVCRNFVALMITLREFKEQDATAHGLLTRMNNCKFVGTMLLLNLILPHLNALSKLFQKDHTCYASIKPALEATKGALAKIMETNAVELLEEYTKPGGQYADLELQISAVDPVRKFLQGLLRDYCESLERNLDRRFGEASPVLQAFSVFDPTTLPSQSSESEFLDHGKQEIEVLCRQFDFDLTETQAQWQNFKFHLRDWKVPAAVLSAEKYAISPTHFVLKKLVREQAIYTVGFKTLVQLAQVCLTQPLGNAVVERGASAVKRVKTRLRSNMKNTMLSSLLHISLNGPTRHSEECEALLTNATQIWRKTHSRNLPQLKILPKVGGSDHADSLCHPLMTVECGVQANLTDMPPLNEPEEDVEVEQAKLDNLVHVGQAPVCGDEDYQNALRSLAFDDGADDSGLESDYEF